MESWVNSLFMFRVVNLVCSVCVQARAQTYLIAILVHIEGMNLFFVCVCVPKEKINFLKLQNPVSINLAMSKV